MAAKLRKRITREQKAIREQWLALAHRLLEFARDDDDNLAAELSQLQRELCDAFFGQGEYAEYTDVLVACPMVVDAVHMLPTMCNPPPADGKWRCHHCNQLLPPAPPVKIEGDPLTAAMAFLESQGCHSLLCKRHQNTIAFVCPNAIRGKLHIAADGSLVETIDGDHIHLANLAALRAAWLEGSDEYTQPVEGSP